MAMRIQLDHAGIGQMLRSAEVAAEIASLAGRVAAEARGHASVSRHGVPVDVTTYETDRAAASVALAHPTGIPIQAKHGVLTDAARRVGLEVNESGDGGGLVEYTNRRGKTRMVTRAQAAAYERRKKK